MMPAPELRYIFITCAHLWVLISCVFGSCRFPQFLQKADPWVGDYKDGRIVAYVKPTLISLTERNVKFSRECVQRVPDNKFLIMHREENLGIRYLCMQFLQRGENIVQIKTSELFLRQSLDICDESGMVIDPYPLVNSGQTPESSVNCPFTGGYNIYAYHPHPNNSAVCNNLMLLMRMESECDQGEGITFDFRREECVPKDLPRRHIQKAHCVAYWTQENYTFIILQHADIQTQWFCLRTDDPLNNIKSAYLWLKVICDTSKTPSPDVSQNYLRLELSKRIFSSTCADEIELCQEMSHYCSMSYSRHCSHTCGQCLSENQIGMCTFEEQYRGRWIESRTQSDAIVDVDAYSLHSDQSGKYDCLNLDSDQLPGKRVLLELYSNGCFPRYACVEMEKVTSSVMKFRLGARLTWPLRGTKNHKQEICKKESFQYREKYGVHALKDKPPILLVNTEYIKEIHCDLPERLQNGIAFREDGKHCGGCLHYEPNMSPNYFTISPVNCSLETSDNKGYRNVPIQYSCLATFQFYNNTYSVVTKTTNFGNGLGQYLVWIFTPENHIKVLKAADTFLFAQSPFLKSDLIQAQFSILRNDNMQCRIFFFHPRSTTTTTTTQRRKNWSADNSDGGINDKNDGIRNEFSNSEPSIHGNEHGRNVPKKENPSQMNVASNEPRYDNSKAESIKDTNSACRRQFIFETSLLCSAVSAIVIFFASRTLHVVYFRSVT